MTSGKARDDNEMARALFDGFVDAILPVIRDYLAHGTRDHAAIAEAFNARGIPCWGRERWIATDIRMVLSHGQTRQQASTR
ncbi:hypothetical protein E8L99_09700 [Phreatobacter aquaticus]|uniref:Recombinase domain-containing protein n=1 Tax=Phreatobacter aquaticus TaxID=2570229 RepID=A0A4D7QDC6_9HYPH|nr:hypothetical protein [Phreatobacter aquaticus]QCK86010.1 hypothetical protein E8L99_09700 [Phreatobacter aquaticus]